MEIKGTSIPVEAAQVLLEMIQSGVIKAGSQLPPERSLQKQLGISRVSLREALNILEVLKVVKRRAGKGSMVQDINIDTFLDPGQLAKHVTLGERDLLLDLMDFRLVIECHAASLAAERINQHYLDQLQTALFDMRNAHDTHDDGKFIDSDFMFHQVLAWATRSHVYQRIFYLIHSLLRTSLQRTVRQVGAYERAIREHEAVLDAIEAGDAQGARQAMEQHLADVRADLERSVD